jgi:hypothetical protein
VTSRSTRLSRANRIVARTKPTRDTAGRRAPQAGMLLKTQAGSVRMN